MSHDLKNHPLIVAGGDMPRWVLADATKTPLQANGRNASTQNPATWTDANTALTALIGLQSRRYKSKQGADVVGIGFVFCGSTYAPFVGIDFDDCVVEGQITKPWVKDICKLANTTTEVSLSGRGLHLYFIGEEFVPPTVKKPEFEVYSEGRYFLLGVPVDHTPPAKMTSGLWQKIEERLPKAASTSSDAAIAQPLPAGPTVSANSDEMRRWLQVAMDSAYNNAASAPKGQRNAITNRETYSLAGRVPYISESDIERLMFMAAEKSGYVAEDGEAAVMATIRSAIQKGKANPLPLPELTPTRPAVVVPEMEAGGEFTPNDDGSASPIATGESVRPWIQVNNVELPDITDASIKALKKLGGTFVRSNELVRVRIDEKNRAGIETMSEAALRGRMARAAVYYTERYNAKTDSRSETIVAPPVNAVQDVMTVGDWPFPALDGVIESPTMRPDGSIVLAPGYDAATRLYLVMSPGLELPAIPNEPEQADVEAALALLADMFVDMPFEDAASRANALGALLTPIARPMIAGPVPMPIFDSPQQGSGKTLTAQLIGLVATGEMPEPSPAPDAPEEWRKSISAQLGAARSVILIDNITRTLEDGSLAAVLTSTTWSDRLLGRNDKQIKLPARACWMATGNNVKVGGDLITRTYLVRLDAKMSRPQERDGFKHPNIEQWVKANRGLLLKAALVLCRAWHVAGRPAPTCPRIRYGEWRTVIGGILQHAGVNEFLGNLRTFQEASDVEGPAWERFILKLIEVFGATVAPAQIYARFSSSDELAALLPPELAGKLSGPEDHKAKSQFAQRIGYLFRERVGKRYGDSQACIVRTRRTSDGNVWDLKSGD